VGVKAKFDWSLNGVPEALLIPKARFGCVRVGAMDISELRGLSMEERRELTAGFRTRLDRAEKKTELLKVLCNAAAHFALLKLTTRNGDELIFACTEKDAHLMLQLTAAPLREQPGWESQPFAG
jgi:hypothetical protein